MYCRKSKNNVLKISKTFRTQIRTLAYLIQKFHQILNKTIIDERVTLTHLKFFSPHHKQNNNLDINSADAMTSEDIASAKIPKLNGGFSPSAVQLFFRRSTLIFCHSLNPGAFASMPQYRYSILHFPLFLQAPRQHPS